MTGQPSSISVIIPVFNGEAFLGSALESVLAQTLPPAEVLVVDDGSTDGSAMVAARYSPHVRLIRQANQGIGGARNTGVAHTHGMLLAFLDADDLWLPNKLAVQHTALQVADAPDMVFGQVENFREEAGAMAHEVPTPHYEGICAGAMLVTRTAFDRVGPFSTRWRIGEFADWYARALELGLRPLTVPHLVLRRRLHAHNTTRAADAARTAYLDVLRHTLRRRQADAANQKPPMLDSCDE